MIVGPPPGVPPPGGMTGPPPNMSGPPPNMSGPPPGQGPPPTGGPPPQFQQRPPFRAPYPHHGGGPMKGNFYLQFCLPMEGHGLIHTSLLVVVSQGLTLTTLQI